LQTDSGPEFFWYPPTPVERSQHHHGNVPDYPLSASVTAASISSIAGGAGRGIAFVTLTNTAFLIHSTLTFGAVVTFPLKTERHASRRGNE